MNDTAAVLIMYTFALVCPAITLLVLSVLAFTCRSPVGRVVFGALSILQLVAALGPVFIVNGGIVPWWLSSDSYLVGRSGNVESLVWQYAFASTLLYAILCFLASSIRPSRSSPHRR